LSCDARRARCSFGVADYFDSAQAFEQPQQPLADDRGVLDQEDAGGRSVVD
jgi:hypothetical protein